MVNVTNVNENDFNVLMILLIFLQQLKAEKKPENSVKKIRFLVSHFWKYTTFTHAPFYWTKVISNCMSRRISLFFRQILCITQNCRLQNTLDKNQITSSFTTQQSDPTWQTLVKSTFHPEPPYLISIMVINNITKQDQINNTAKWKNYHWYLVSSYIFVKMV